MSNRCKSDQDIGINDLPLHGGDIAGASQRYGIPVDQWIDLSTGINPVSYPIPIIDHSIFQRLPYIQQSFLSAVEHYYGSKNFLAVAGSQAAIHVLPKVLNSLVQLPVLLPKVGYQEHAIKWLASGAEVNHYSSQTLGVITADIERALDENPKQHLVLINPNNPTAVTVEKQQVLDWAEKLDANTYLIVDEAFMDVCPEKSLLSDTPLADNIIVLRSFGKFFGLAGMRLGFVFANPTVLTKIAAETGIWQVNGPAQFIATQALQDTNWQHLERKKLRQHARVLEFVLAPIIASALDGVVHANLLFQSLQLPVKACLAINLALAKQGILTRVVILDDRSALLRVGIFDSDDSDLVERLRQIFQMLG